MAYICRLVKGTQTVDLQYNVGAGFSLLDRGIKLGRPERVSLYGGRLQLELVRQEDGKRTIPLRLIVEGTSGVNLIDRVNELEAMLRDAARYRYDGWGDEVFLELQIDDPTDTVRFPVCEGEIDTDRLYEKCGGEASDMIRDLPVRVTCEPYWEDDSTFTLENYVDNPGWWRWAALPGDSWAEVNAADVTSTHNATYWEMMGYSLQMVIAPDGINDTGVQSDNITVVAATQYYFQCRCRHTTGADDLTARVYDVSNAAVIPASALTFDNQDNAWETLGAAFTTPAGCVLIRVEIQRLAGDSTAGNKTYQVDGVYVGLGGTAPTGWVSGRNLTNELDAADQINVLCVSDIPGEVDAELKLNAEMGGIQTEWYLARRTRDAPHDFIWHLHGHDAFTTAETGGAPCAPGNTSVTCSDSDKSADATAPGGCRVDVSFAATQTMALRCYWVINTNLDHYYGKFALIVMAKATGDTDTINMETRAYQDVVTANYWDQDGIIKQQVPVPTVEDWALIDGWALYSFPIGTHDNDLWDTGNQWVIEVWAEHVTADGITDTLQIAGAYLVPLDDSYFIAGRRAIPAAANSIWSIKDMDGDRGVFIRNAAVSRYYSNLGGAGVYPSLVPEEDNWFYFILGGRGSWTNRSEASITDTATVSLEYRPQGIFLRGTDP